MPVPRVSWKCAMNSTPGKIAISSPDPLAHEPRVGDAGRVAEHDRLRAFARRRSGRPSRRRAVGMSPFTGQPYTVPAHPMIRTPSACARFMIAACSAIASACVIRKLSWLCASLDEIIEDDLVAAVALLLADLEAVEPLRVRHQDDVRDAGPPLDPLQHVGRVGELRQQLRVREGGDLELREAGPADAVEHLDLVVGGHEDGHRLQAVARPAFAGDHRFRQAHHGPPRLRLVVPGLSARPA